MKMLNNPHTVKLYQVFESDGNIYMVMEIVLGGSMDAHLNKHGKFSEEEARHYFQQIFLVVEYLHNMKIIHR